jgi:hypothetical protein
VIIAQFEGDMMEHVPPVSSTPDHSAGITARRAAGSLRVSAGALYRAHVAHALPHHLNGWEA